MKKRRVGYAACCAEALCASGLGPIKLRGYARRLGIAQDLFRTLPEGHPDNVGIPHIRRQSHAAEKQFQAK